MLAGSIVALVTPMHRSGEVDWAALDRLIDWHLESGTHGIVPVGTTGESATLSVDEHIKVVERTVVRVAKQIPVIAGTGANSTSEAIELTRAAARGRRRCVSAGDAVLQQADAGRSLSALQGDRRGRRRSAGAVQRSRPHCVRHEGGDGRPARRRSTTSSASKRRAATSIASAQIRACTAAGILRVVRRGRADARHDEARRSGHDLGNGQCSAA